MMALTYVDDPTGNELINMVFAGATNFKFPDRVSRTDGELLQGVPLIDTHERK